MRFFCCFLIFNLLPIVFPENLAMIPSGVLIVFSIYFTLSLKYHCNLVYYSFLFDFMKIRLDANRQTDVHSSVFL